MMAGGVRHGDLFTITLPAHAVATAREHSWRYDWIMTVISAMKEIEAAGKDIVVPVDFATADPSAPIAVEGHIVIKSYESGGEILRFENGAWCIAGRQPETIQ